MGIKLSTGLRNKVLDTSPLRTILNLGFIKIYSGAAPADADAAVTGTLLLTVSNNSTGTGLTFEAAAAGGVLSKKASETWAGVVAATGTAGYFRFVSASDTGASSTTEARMQGVVGTVGAELNVSSTTFTSSTTRSIANFAVAVPVSLG